MAHWGQKSSLGFTAYSISATTGALTAVPGSPFGGSVLSENIGGLTVDPTGRSLYKANLIEGSTGQALNVTIS